MLSAHMPAKTVRHGLLVRFSTTAFQLHFACKIPVKTYIFSPIFLPHSNCVAAYLQAILQLECNCRAGGSKQATITRKQNRILTLFLTVYTHPMDCQYDLYGNMAQKKYSCMISKQQQNFSRVAHLPTTKDYPENCSFKAHLRFASAESTC